MQAFGRFVLSFIVALLAAFVVGGGACASGVMLTTTNNSFVTSDLGAGIGLLLLFGGSPIGASVFILVMIKMQRLMNNRNNQKVGLELPAKIPDQSPPDSEA